MRAKSEPKVGPGVKVRNGRSEVGGAKRKLMVKKLMTTVSDGAQDAAVGARRRGDDEAAQLKRRGWQAQQRIRRRGGRMMRERAAWLLNRRVSAC